MLWLILGSASAGRRGGETSLRKRLMILVLSVAVPAALAMGGLVGLNVLEAQKAQERALLETARAVSTAVDMDVVRNVEALEALASSDAVAARSWEGVRDRARRLHLGPRAWVSASDRSGARLLNTFDDLSTGSLPQAHGLPRPASVLTALSKRRPVISDLFSGAASGKPVVAIDAPAPNGDDDVVVSVILDPVRFLEAIERRPLPAGALVTLVDGRRRVIARSRDHARHLGASATPAMVAAMETAPEGVVPSRSLDGERTVVAYTRSSLSGWTAMVVVPRRTIEAPIWANLAGVAAVFLLLAGLSTFAVRHQSRTISGELDALERDATAMGRGDAVARRCGLIPGFDRVQGALSCASVELARRDERQRLLINELNHRVKNTLATVQALAAQTFRGAEPEARGKFEQRLAALGGAHDLLTQTTWADVEMHGVVARCGSGHDGRIQASGPSILLPPEAALALCMLVHELTTNSLKYGALSRPEGRVVVGWALGEAEEVGFTWRETGGPRVETPPSEGFGTKLMDRLVRHELNGRLDRQYEPGGLIVRGCFRLPEESRFRSDL